MSSSTKKGNNGGENERTSLLSSSTAPPTNSTGGQQQQQPISPFPQKLALSSRSLLPLTRTLEEMERGAKRLVDEDILGDSDSVNGLLADVASVGDVESVGSVASDYELDGEGEGAQKQEKLTMDDVEYLLDPKKSRQSSQQGKKALSQSASAKLVDEIGQQLLNAEGNPELEQRILRQSLNLVGLGLESLDFSDEVTEEEEGKRAYATLKEKDHDAHVASLVDEWEKKLEAQQQKDQPPPSHPSERHTVSAQGRPRPVLERVAESTRALRATVIPTTATGSGRQFGSKMSSLSLVTPSTPSASAPELDQLPEDEYEYEELKKPIPLVSRQVAMMICLTLLVILILVLALALGTVAVGPPHQPIGEYKIVEAQVGEEFWKFYDFYSGKDSAGSNGYLTYVSEEVARKENIIQVLTEVVKKENMVPVYEDGEDEINWLEEDLKFLQSLKEKERKKQEDNGETDESEESAEEALDEDEGNATDVAENSATTESDSRHLHTETEGSTGNSTEPKLEPFNPDTPLSYIPLSPNATNSTSISADPSTPADPTETFILISSSPTPLGPRNSIRLEGRRRFNRGLFIIDLRHMPAGCGTWPAFWLTDEANWPVNGEIDIVEGVNYQDTAKTALHSTRECRMDDVPEGSKTGSWDTAVGIPDKKTGVPDMTFRYATDCFVYDPHQWLNQGCVATDLKLEGKSLGVPLNENGGGVYALEWDPINRHIRTWVFSPHGRVPRNLREALRTATNVEEGTRVAPDTGLWGLPYGHFPIGEGTNCPSEHFRNMRLVINLAFCGSVSGNRYFMDCPKQFKKFKTCNEWVASDPEELKEAYWKIRGVYVYEREWEQQWS